MSADQSALPSHVEVLARSPRNGTSGPGHLANCAEYVAADWAAPATSALQQGVALGVGGTRGG